MADVSCLLLEDGVVLTEKPIEPQSLSGVRLASFELAIGGVCKERHACGGRYGAKRARSDDDEVDAFRVRVGHDLLPVADPGLDARCLALGPDPRPASKTLVVPLLREEMGSKQVSKAVA